MAFCSACKRKSKPFYYSNDITKYVQEIEQDTAFLSIFDNLSVYINTRGEYYVVMFTASEEGREKLRFFNVNLDNRKMFYVLDPMLHNYDDSLGILERKTGCKLFTPQFYNFSEALFKQMKNKHLLSISCEPWGYSLHTTLLSDSSYAELAKTGYRDISYNEEQFERCGGMVKYRYEVFIVRDSAQAAQFISGRNRDQTLRKLTDKSYIFRTMQYSEFDMFSDVPEYYCNDNH